jgi:2,3-bisphosphoglycerate-dependent phosphoglycerate mutase
MSTLILLRHGQSQWNLENRFTGWTDISLTSAGREDAILAGKSLQDVSFDVVFLSRLIRAKETFECVLQGYGPLEAPVFEDSALNERHYGDLQGLDKGETAKKYGEEQVHLWRRSYSVRPPNGESLEDCERRAWPFFRQYILPYLKAGKNVLIVAHGNSLKPIIKNLDHMEPEKVAVMEVFCSVPYEYSFDGETVTKKVVRDVPGMVVKGTAKIA